MLRGIRMHRSHARQVLSEHVTVEPAVVVSICVYVCIYNSVHILGVSVKLVGSPFFIVTTVLQRSPSWVNLLYHALYSNVTHYTNLFLLVSIYEPLSREERLRIIDHER